MRIAPSIVVLGVGNILMRDDGIGVWVTRYLMERYRFPSRVGVIEGGVAGLHLLSYMDHADDLLIIDAMREKGNPGSIYWREWNPPSKEFSGGRTITMSAHEFSIRDLLSMAHFLGKVPRVRILGVEPAETDRMEIGLTPSLRAAFPEVVKTVLEELGEMGVAFEETGNQKGAFTFSVTGEKHHA